jgi:hypothetical protein
MNSQYAVQLMPAPDSPPYNREDFVTRDDEEKLVASRVQMGRSGNAIKQPIINFCGVIGIGKTWLLHRLVEEYSFRNNAPAEQGKPTLSARVDFKEFPSPNDHIAVLLAMLDQLSGQLPDESYLSDALKRTREVEQAAARLDDKTQSVEETARLFVRVIRTLSGNYVPVLAFDSAGWAKGKLTWLEENVIAPIARDDNVVFIFAARQMLRWRKLVVRSRVYQHQLQPFDKEKIRKQIKRFPSVGNVIYPISFGHPLTTRIISDEIEKIGRQKQTPVSETLLRDNKKTIGEIVDTQVIQTRFFHNVPGEIQTLLRVMCVLRKFNPIPLRHFAGQFVEKSYYEKPGAFYLDTIGRMVDTTLVEWSSARGGYVLDPVARRIMARNLLEREPERYIELNQAAIDLYEQWIENFPESSGDFLIEKLYHTASVMAAEQKTDIVEHLKEELRAVLERGVLNLDHLTQLHEELKRDDELGDLITPGELDTLCAMVDEHARKLEIDNNSSM